jgi:solute carrier family 25 carnitine/acylcarnitine transporter 20/29
VSFWGFDTGDKLVRLVASLPAGQALTLPQLCIAGGFSALPTSLVMVPAERIKCLLQIQQAGGSTKKKNTDQPHYKGFGDCASQLYRREGLKGLYKGMTLTLLRDVPGCMVYFGVYTVAKNALGDSPIAALAAGAMAGISFWPVILPMDCLKSRYQTAPDGTYSNIGQVYTQLVKEEGIGGLFAGIGPAMIRSAPANAVSFLGAELTKQALASFS